MTFRNVTALIAFLFGSLSLAACGGGGGGNAGGGANNPPPQVFNYDTLIALTDGVGNNNTSFQVVSSVGRVTDNGFEVGIDTNSGNDQISFNEATNTLTIDISNQNIAFEASFTENDIIGVGDGLISAGVISGGRTVVIEYIEPGATLYNGQAYSYLTGGRWLTFTGNTLPIDMGYVVGGIETFDADMPTTGTANYNAVTTATIIGPAALVPDGIVDARATGTFTVNFGNGSLQGEFPTFEVFEFDDVVYLGTLEGFTLTGNITGDTNRFGGTTARPAQDGTPAMNGQFNGAFFGPDGMEMGGTYTLSTGGSSLTDVNVIGGFAGERN